MAGIASPPKKVLGVCLIFNGVLGLWYRFWVDGRCLGLSPLAALDSTGHLASCRGGPSLSPECFTCDLLFVRFCVFVVGGLPGVHWRLAMNWGRVLAFDGLWEWVAERSTRRPDTRRLQLVEGRDGRIMELERDNALLRAEIEALQRRLHEELERG